MKICDFSDNVDKKSLLWKRLATEIENVEVWGSGQRSSSSHRATVTADIFHATQLCIVYCGPAWHDTMCTTSAQSVVEYRSQSRGGEHRGDVLSTQYMGTWGGPQYMGQLVEPIGTWAIGTWALYFFFWGGRGGLVEKSLVLKSTDISSHTLR